MEEMEKDVQTPKEKMSLETLKKLALPLYKLQENDDRPFAMPERNEYAEAIMKAFLEILPHITYLDIYHAFSCTCIFQTKAYRHALTKIQNIHLNPQRYEMMQKRVEEEEATMEEPPRQVCIGKKRAMEFKTDDEEDFRIKSNREAMLRQIMELKSTDEPEYDNAEIERMKRKNKASAFMQDPWNYGVFDNQINTQNVITVDLKEYYDPQLLYLKIDECARLLQKGTVQAIVFIHGYGSQNTAALIHDRTREYLRRKYGRFRIVNGEDFNIFNEDARVLHTQYPELDILLQVCNHGVTVVGNRK